MKYSHTYHTYPDGSGYWKIGRDTDFTFRINNYEDLFLLGKLIEGLNYKYRHQPKHFNITIPNLIDAQADRRFGNDQDYGLIFVINYLNFINHRNNITWYIFHPHNASVLEAALNNFEELDNSTFIEQAITQILGAKYMLNNSEYYQNLILMSSDAGGFKPLMNVCSNINWKGPTYSASKARFSVGDVHKIMQIVDRKDFKGKDILIVDDICVYGGTFKGLAQILRESNCGKLYLAVSHMTVQDLGKAPVTNYFDKVFTTNSKYDNYFIKVNSPSLGEIDVIPENLEIINKF